MNPEIVNKNCPTLRFLLFGAKLFFCLLSVTVNAELNLLFGLVAILYLFLGLYPHTHKIPIDFRKRSDQRVF